MDLEVVGRHAMLFDDDAMAAFVNTRDALVDWNSLSIDRYDVRHLLPNPPPPLKRRYNRTRSSSPPFLPDGSLEQDLDHERYLDLPPASDEQVQDVNAVMMDTTGYHAVVFSYGNPDESTEQKDNDAESIFHPPFPVPESLTRNLPPTEKVHQIIARTALFVSKQGGQSEIILRVKQGDNPAFGFLMPDHHLHVYFRFLVDHQDLLKCDDGKSLEEEKKTDSGLDQRGGALSLLGSVYGSGEDEDGITDGAPEVKYGKPEETVDTVSANVSHGSEQKESSGNLVTDDVVSSNILPLKEKDHVIKRNRSISTVKGGTTTVIRKEGDVAANKSQASAVLPSTSKIELPIVEPPSDLKRVVEKIVEFILKNGREFEAVLAEQDRKFGRFPFLLPSNQYHTYYLKVLKETQEAKLLGKCHVSEKRDSVGHGIDKKTVLSKDGDTFSSRSADPDVLYEYDRKEKFKMVIGKSKKDGQDPAVKANQPQVGVSADAAAAILKAATRGIKNPSLEVFPKPSSSGIGQGPSYEGGHSSSFGSLHASQHQSSIKRVDENGEPSVSVPVAKAIAETAALAAASEADSSEASWTREQKLKAERLKRAKVFAAMLKGRSVPLNTEPLRGLSVEPLDRGFLRALKNETFETKISIDECNERRSKRSYRSRSKRHGGEEEEEDDDDELGKEEEDKHRRDHKHSRKKHRSHRSSHHSKDRHTKRKRHSSSKDRESQQHNEHDSYSSDEHHQSPHQSKYSNSNDEHWPSKRRKHYSPSDSEHRQSRHQRKHVSSSDDEHRHSRRWHRHGGSSEDEHSHTRSRHKRCSPPGGENRSRNRDSRHSKSHSKREMELEEGEICAKSDQSKASESERASREASVDLSKSYQHGRAPSQTSESTEVSDDLRAKIRAMLMATL
ncbi:hypothetical protein FNV43_RR03860 [Rhamnella rubrinervis]|uniref:SURP motif domain-containing protein n=1 Tax=Rhamnella rubrinervis TaxID=2594499 RepID=A0A8K0HKL4_9ROSA|nr:hypothetical protein FNV43_RR03860 [Rhamnella rubrinervis]